MLPLLLLLPACVRVTQLGADTDPGDSGDSAAPAEGVCLPDAVTGFAMPGGTWALASLYGARRLEDVPDSALRLEPAWFLASAWQATAFGCDDFGSPWSPAASAEAEGCMRVQEGTHWVELCRLFPQAFPCDDREALTAGDRVTGGVVAVTWHALAAHALLQRLDVDPDAWVTEAEDPRALESLAALQHFAGAWSWQVEDVIEGCSAQLTDCMEAEPLRHVEGVLDKLERLEGAGCYDAPLEAAEVERFLDELAPFWPAADWEAARAAALAQVDGRGFSQAGPAVLDALDAAVSERLLCPERELWDQYRLSCP